MSDEREMRERTRKWLNSKHFTSDSGVTLDCLAMLPDEHTIALTIGQLAEIMAAFAASERDAERERCCKDVCADCRCGLPLTTDGDLNERHYILHQNGTTKILTSHCKSAAIRSRVAAKGEK